jgi:hypothetical protein
MHANTALYAATLLALVSQISAIQVTSPSSSTVWSSGTSGQTVSWQAVSTDPTSFVIQLVNQVSERTSARAYEGVSARERGEGFCGGWGGGSVGNGETDSREWESDGARSELASRRRSELEREQGSRL